ncbi:MAG: hypothetical protein AB7P03_29775 [Kofleriaceae bacterium]
MAITLLIASCGRVGFDPMAADASLDAALPETCLGHPVTGVAFDVLDNSGFESGLCTDLVVPGWTIARSSGWPYYDGRPLVSNSTGCDVGWFGCDQGFLSEFANTGAGCLAIWGERMTPVGEWVEVRQTYAAPAPILGFALSFARGSGQVSYDWGYQVTFETAGVPTVLETVDRTDPRTSVTVAANPQAASTDLTIAIRLNRLGAADGHVWVYLDDVKLDVCW